jgi:hypothetical protein
LEVVLLAAKQARRQQGKEINGGMKLIEKVYVEQKLEDVFRMEQL